jgi:hypothetical protein
VNRLLPVFTFACTGVPPTVDTDPPPATPVCPSFGEPVAIGQVPSPPASEVSGLAVGVDRIWVHNDSGEGPEVFRLDQDGALRASFTLTGALAVDFEDMARGPGPDGQTWLYIGDIGDNLMARQSISVWRFREPEGDGGPIDAERLELRYPDGPKDAETLLVDPEDGALYVVTKVADGRSGVYQLLVPVPGLHTLVLVDVLEFGTEPLGQTTLVTGGDLGSAGLVLRTYLTAAFVWPAAPGDRLPELLEREPCEVEIAPEPQGEAIGWSPDGLITISEGEDPAVNLVPWQTE